MVRVKIPSKNELLQLFTEAQIYEYFENWEHWESQLSKYSDLTHSYIRISCKQCKYYITFTSEKTTKYALSAYSVRHYHASKREQSSNIQNDNSIKIKNNGQKKKERIFSLPRKANKYPRDYAKMKKKNISRSKQNDESSKKFGISKVFEFIQKQYFKYRDNIICQELVCMLAQKFGFRYGESLDYLQFFSNHHRYEQQRHQQQRHQQQRHQSEPVQNQQINNRQSVLKPQIEQQLQLKSIHHQSMNDDDIEQDDSFSSSFLELINN